MENLINCNGYLNVEMQLITSMNQTKKFNNFAEKDHQTINRTGWLVH